MNSKKSKDENKFIAHCIECGALKEVSPTPGKPLKFICSKCARRKLVEALEK